jgi:hypothetical protein
MHYFESQLVSTVRAIEDTDEEVVFVGHYRHGDGASLPACAILMAAVPLFVTGGAVALSISVPFFAGAVAFAIFEKKIIVGLRTARVQVSARTVFGRSSKTYPVAGARLQTQRIHIRLAENCGAIDLFLPDQTIRLSVDGHFDRSVAVAERLSARSGIEMTVAR